ncbi:MAG: hypothetical protein K0V04_14340 [Deltaproteobacteria bacterium]|nr:hypothetical protein [Deltaproteobacteria bacterium]
MTEAKKFKRAVRARAQRTGESYAVARQHVLAKTTKERERSTAAAAATARRGSSKGSVSEAKCIEKTGHGFDHWFAVLDEFGARRLGHTAAARHLRVDHAVPSWYSQGITVAYERARGLRELNQVCAGTFEVSVSRVLPVSVDEAVVSLSRKAQRERWLPAVGGELAAVVPQRLASKRFRRNGDVAIARFPHGEAKIELRITPKADGRSTIVARLTALADKAAVEHARGQWRALLDAMRAHCRGTKGGA